MVVAAIDWMKPDDPAWQWINLTFGVVGLLLGVVSAWQSTLAARRAKAATLAAREARNAAMQLARHDRLQELQMEFQDLQLLVDTPSLLAAKCHRLRALVVGFKTEAVRILDEYSLERLDIAREQLMDMSKTAFNTTLKAENRLVRLQSAFGEIAEALSIVAATLGRELTEQKQ